MSFHPYFPPDPYALLDPSMRWVPGDGDIREAGGREKLIPPLVHHIRCGVKTWRDQDYPGISPTTRALLTHWFQTDHWIEGPSDEKLHFRWYFAQQEAVESAIWLYEVIGCKDSRKLLQFDASGHLTSQHFKEEWPRYVMKMATGAGKTKVISLLLTWCYFHKLYEADSSLSGNFLVIAPNIIVLDRLKADFLNAKIFKEDPLIPENGYKGKAWEDDFKPFLHIQDEVGTPSHFGNIYLTNIHRLFLTNTQKPSVEDSDSSEYFLGSKPVNKTTDSKLDLGILIRQIPDLVIFNDEAHHIHDDRMAWAETLKDIHDGLVQQGHTLSAQFDVTATPKHMNGSIFPHTISDYPLCEAIFQGVVKQPVIPDDASMAKLQEKVSDSFVESYEDHLNLGYIEWRKIYDVMAPLGKKAVLFIMTDQTQTCDEVKDYLETKYPELIGAILVIHTKRDGNVDEGDKGDLQDLRQASREIDSLESPYKVIVSVMMLREGWDVQNVTTIVGLRPYKAISKILPEQTLGRGLRRMLRGRPIEEEPKLSVIGTQAFIDFVKSIKTEGVDLDYTPMGMNTPHKIPMLIQVDESRKHSKDLEIVLPILTPRMHRDWKNLNELKLEDIKFDSQVLLNFPEKEQRQIIFMDINTDQVSHMTDLTTQFLPDYHRAVHFFTQTIMRDLRLVGGMDILFGKIKDFLENRLFAQKVDLNDLNVLRNLSENSVRHLIIESFKEAINALTVTNRGTSEIKDTIHLSKMRPFQVRGGDFITPKKSMLTKIVGDNQFELNFCSFLDHCPDIMAYVKNNYAFGFFLDYRNEEGRIANYFPDFIVKRTEKEIWIIELKGREDVEVPHKRQRLEQYCEDATAQAANTCVYKSLYIKQEDWEHYRARNFNDIVKLFTPLWS